MKTLLVMYVALVILAISGCKPKTQDQQATVPPISGDCVSNQANCQQNLYNTPGYTPYTYNNQYNNQYNNSPYGGGYYGGGYYSGNQYGGYSNGPFQYMNNAAYLCNCQNGFMPTYNSYAGLGCVQANQGYNGGTNNGAGFGGGAYAYFNWGANNNHWTNMPQISNHTAYTNAGCYNGVVQSCLVDRPNTCSVGYTCQAESASSRLGLCRSNTTTGQGGNSGTGPVVR